MSHYEQGLAAGRIAGRISCPYDGRTKAGKEWWRGFLVGDAERCAEQKPTLSEDPKDVIIRTLTAEVVKLANALEVAGSRLAGEGWSTGTSATLRAKAARALLARMEVLNTGSGDYLEKDKAGED